MKADALLNVTSLLRDRFQAALAEASLPDSVFVGPLDDPGATGASLVLLLYRVVPNADLRNSERRVPSSTPPKVDLFQNSLPLDLHYLLTVGTEPGASEEIGLHKLGVALLALQLEPNLSGASLSYETVRVTLEPLTTEESGRIWALFPAANYRTSIAFVASPVWLDPAKPTAPAKPVTNDGLKTGAKPVEVGV